MIRVYDTFMLRDELDLLECRLEELESVIDWFVIVEAPFTHGEREAKQLYFRENSARFQRWTRKIRYVEMMPDDVPYGNPWEREHAQREQCRKALHDARPDDLVLHGDLDEIPSVSAVNSAVSTDVTHVFEQRMTHYAVDWLDYEAWPGTIAARYGDIAGFQWLRSQRFNLPRIHSGGWHLSNLGTVEDQVNHVRWGCHINEVIADGSWDGISSGKFYRDGYHRGTVKLEPVDVDHTWPKYIYERRCPAVWFRPRL